MTSSSRPRRVLLIFPHYTPSFGTFQYAFPIVGMKAFMPPQGLLVIAATLPEKWEIRFVDENICRTTDKDLDWCDAVFVSGMHIQRNQINDICRRAHAKGKVAVLGGPSVSACPHYYPEFDYLHVGEVGDATDTLVQFLEVNPSRPASQVVLTTVVRRDLTEFPLPAYELCQLDAYLMGSIQFSSGCPYDCEFCDIPALYGRNPRLKSPQQIVAELDKMRACGLSDAVYFVDDNFIGNRRGVRELLPVLIEWQKRHSFPLSLACEATLNIAKRPELLELMREAKFETVFCGIETPDPEALKAMSKEHNTVAPILESVRVLNSFGMEVVSGIIMGLDADTLDTGKALLEFVQQSRIPLLTINLLQALPHTKLWDRLEREGRLVDDAGRESNVLFHLPHTSVVEMWRELIAKTYDPDALFARYEHQIRTTYANRPAISRKVTGKMIRRGLGIFVRLVIAAGVKSHYRSAFWRFAWPLLKKGNIEALIGVGIVAHHLIMFAREAALGQQNASFYSDKIAEPEIPSNQVASA